MNKIVVITGGNTGIGKCTAETFRKKGDTVISISKGIDEEYPDFSYDCDITDEQAVSTVISAIGAKFGHIDVVVNNAGFGVNGPLELIPSDTVDAIFDVNVMGAIKVTKYSLPFMSKGAKVIYISSVSGMFGAPFRSLYCGSKSAMLMIAMCQRMELQESGIQVCAICPGEVKTGFMKKRVRVTETNVRYGKQVERAFEFLDRHDNGHRMGPESVANAVVKQAYKRKTKPFKIIGFQFKLIYLGVKLLPARFVLFITNKFMGGGKI